VRSRGSSDDIIGDRRAVFFLEIIYHSYAAIITIIINEFEFYIILSPAIACHTISVRVENESIRSSVVGHNNIYRAE